MRTTKPHIIVADYRDCSLSKPSENDDKVYLASVHRASKKAIDIVASAMEGDEDGRSEFLWLRLANGDLMLGVFPRGDTYLDVEGDAQFPRGKK